MYKVQKNKLKIQGEQLRLIKLLSISCTKLYNVGAYSVKSHFEKTSEYLPYAKNYHACKTNEHYKLLLTDIGQQILRFVERSYKSYFSLLKLKNSGKFSDKISPPKFKKTDSYSAITVQGRSSKIKDGYVILNFSKEFKNKYNPKIKQLKFKMPQNIKVEKLQELRIVPKFSGKEWEIHFVYIDNTVVNKVSGNNSLGIDLGVDNFAACFNGCSGDSFILNGKKIKSINQLYNKRKARLKTNSRKFINNSNKRENCINDIFNNYVNHIIKYCRDNKITKIVIGELNKSSINIGKVNNQKFYCIPHGKFISKLKNKCSVNGIEVYLQEESYTSKCSFFDNEKIAKHDIYMGKRIHRGLFKTKNGLLVNADVNGAANILTKSKCRPYRRACSGFVANPVRFF